MRLEITCQDRLGITQDVLDILVEHKIDLRGIEIDRAGKIFLNFPNIEFEDFQHLMPKIRRIDGITDVKTTAFMPVEREKHQLRAILQTLPDPVFSIDRRGLITQINDAVEVGISTSHEQLLGAEISEVVKGFNFNKWLDGKDVLAQAHKLQFADQDYLADILPIFISDSQEEKILAGAVVLLKSELRLGEQLSAFNRPKTRQFEHVIAQSQAMKRTLETTQKLAVTGLPLLLLGEPGSGKKTLANAVHQASFESEAPVHVLNTLGVSTDEIAQSLLGSSHGVLAQFARVQEGTLILEELTDISIDIQIRLLRLVKTGEFTAEEDKHPTRVKVRLIACSSHDLDRAIEQGKALPELVNYLMASSIVLPPLRERRADILPLVDIFIQQHCMTLGRKRARLSKAASDFVLNYPWPGNVQQLEQTLHRALALGEESEIQVDDLQLPSSTTQMSFVDENFEGSLDQEVKRFEKQLLTRLYPFYPSTRQLAKKLGLSHTAIANKLRDYGISRSSAK
ncbi:TyrR/PhhR family helix-turn-helix DNA-binding protein [Alteromonas facilis]|uniref:TyrR/PhhR family helix-turn-helix DNA-binding protein n=1 Tax=Alteromonas facilis TaxID=2048004 RepID=UPI000C285D9C|nr:TyrR/PhhR family helix-turn-helix DNA-binding protein [Alteromonas facilis]